MIHLDKHQKDQIKLLVHDYSGIVIERVASRQLHKKIEDQMKLFGIGRIDDYIKIISNYEYNSRAMEELIAEITVCESFFFRNPDQFRFLAEVLLPCLKNRLGASRAIRIWSAGCSRGEEAYSLAMTARHFSEKNPEIKFLISAGDINSKNLLAAKEAVYNCRSLRDKLAVFEEEFGFNLGERDLDGNCIVSQSLRDMVGFHKLNLKNLSGLKCLAGSDIIFCRNVLIYFDEKLRHELVREFYQLLNPGGVLFLGESECFPGNTGYFELISHRNSYAYKKPESNKSL